MRASVYDGGDATVSLPAVLRASSRVVIANRQLRRVTAAWGLWVTGEWAFLVLLSVTAFDRGGTGAVAAVGVVRMIPGAVAAPVLSLAADRLSRVHVLVGVMLSWMGFVALVPAALLADSLAPIFVIVGAASITGTLLRPAINRWSRRWSTGRMS
jgi:hypothetical protein